MCYNYTVDLGRRAHMKCPRCKNTQVQKKGKRAGKQKYRCTACGATFTEGVDYKPAKKFEKITGINCPKCESSNIIRDGKLEEGSQRYKCKSCGISFSPKTFHRLSDNNALKGIIVTKILNGASVRALAETYGYTPDHLRKMMTPYYKVETITPEQKKNIIKYGFYLNVPVNYMAEYIKCSEHKCTEVLNKFKKKVMSTTHGAI
jgi:transposase-like protein